MCAACARTKRYCKLTRAEFGYAPEPAHAPAWLEWSYEHWHQHGLQWLQHMDRLLHFEAYWRDYFDAPARIELARVELADLAADNEADPRVDWAAMMT